jgi:oxygen-independent coproporphyrinogen-3 oxidase
MDPAAYRDRFGTGAADDFGGELELLAGRGWLERAGSCGSGPLEGGADRIRLTAEGLAHSDAIGPALFSGRVRALMAEYEAR